MSRVWTHAMPPVDGTAPHRLGAQRAVVAASLCLTLLQISTIQASWLLAVVLPVQWLLIFRPLQRREWTMLLFVPLFFAAQNHAALAAGAFAFRQQDFLLMPLHEPLLWMGWYLHLVRWVGEPAHSVALSPAAGWGLLATVLAFSLFGADARALTLASAASCALLLALFHRGADLAYAASAVVLGALVEGVGVANGLWSYPEPDVAGVPWWSFMMWMSVGLLGRRLVVPLAEWLARMGGRHA